MAWQDEMDEYLRIMLGDFEATKFDDDLIERLIVAGAYQVLQESLVFTQNFKADLANTDITPDPTDDSAGTRDDSFINLACLKAACIVNHGDAIKAANQAIAVRDNKSAIDLRGIMEGKLRVLEKGWCATYEDSKFEYQLGSVRIAGAVVMTPFRLYPYGNPRTIY